MSNKRALLAYAFALCCVALANARSVRAQAVPVTVVKDGAIFALQRDGRPYFVKGAGGSENLDLLRQCGGNSFRTWGVDGRQLEAASQHGLTVTMGIWLGHKDQGFDYHNADAVAKQRDAAIADISRFKDSPSLLIWAIGNEMETGQSDDDPSVWKAVEEIAAAAKRIDPHHPTMTVVAEIGGKKVQNIQTYCPDIDIIGINSYGGGASLPERYVAVGGKRPYILTEFGPPGTWEIGKNAWGVPVEPSSTEKATIYKTVYDKAVARQPLCLGSYAFLWGHKQEATTTWFGLLLPDGRKLGAIDALQQEWTDKPASDPCPDLRSLSIVGDSTVAQGKKLQVQLDAASPDGSPLTVNYVVQGEPTAHGTGGADEAAPREFPDAIVQSSPTGATVEVPPYAGSYRLFAYVRDARHGAAVANVPFLVAGGQDMPPPASRKAQLPLSLYGGNAADLPYAPSGYMGNAGAIHMDPASTDGPRTGKTCLKVEYAAATGWGGVVWQSPANDWGDKPGGWNLTGARKLTFWARGANGDEKVAFLFGLIDRNKTFYDTALGKLPDVHLTREWAQYSIPLDHKDLSRILTGFAWTVAANGVPVTFYLDDIRYE